MDEHDERGHHDERVGERVEELPDDGDEPLLLRDPAVEEVGRRQAAVSVTAPIGRASQVVRPTRLPAPNGTFEHRRYGTRARPRIPPLEAKGDFGLFEGVSEARVEMSFEQDGLRTRVTWSGATK